MDEARSIRGGTVADTAARLRSTNRDSFSPYSENNNFGFRVAAIPEPSSIVLIGLVGSGILFIRRFFML
jgi:hypothetical protein